VVSYTPVHEPNLRESWRCTAPITNNQLCPQLIARIWPSSATTRKIVVSYTPVHEPNLRESWRCTAPITNNQLRPQLIARIWPSSATTRKIVVSYTPVRESNLRESWRCTAPITNNQLRPQLIARIWPSSATTRKIVVSYTLVHEPNLRGSWRCTAPITNNQLRPQLIARIWPSSATTRNKVLVLAVLRWRSQPGGQHQHKKLGENARPNCATIKPSTFKHKLQEKEMRLQGKTIAVLVAEGVEDLEFYVPFMRLEEEGATVISAGISTKPVRGKNGLEITPMTTIDELRADEVFALVIPGGWAPDKLRRYDSVKELTRAINAANKVIGVICHGGWVPISAGIVHGRRATGSVGIKDDLVNAGAHWEDVAAFREGNMVWGRVVADIPAFCRELVAALVEAAER
jgi:protease I